MDLSQGWNKTIKQIPKGKKRDKKPLWSKMLIPHTLGFICNKQKKHATEVHPQCHYIIEYSYKGIKSNPPPLQFSILKRKNMTVECRQTTQCTRKIMCISNNTSGSTQKSKRLYKSTTSNLVQQLAHNLQKKR